MLPEALTLTSLAFSMIDSTFQCEGLGLSDHDPTNKAADTPTRDDSGIRGRSGDTPNAPSLYEPTMGDDFEFNPSIAKLVLPCQMGRYMLTRQIGKGGAGIVFQASPLNEQGEADESTATVAVKVLRSEITASATALKRFTKEARLLGEIDNPYVTRMIEFNSQQGLYFMVSEFVDGFSLRELLDRHGKFSIRFSLLVIRDLLRALGALHSSGVVHRDVKPENLLVIFDKSDPHGDDLNQFQQAKLTDFGLARYVEQSESMAMTMQHAVLGTPLYMAPEQYSESRTVDSRADVYAVGATLYHLLAGQPPFDSPEFVGLAQQHKEEVPRKLNSINDSISEGLSNVVAKALEKETDSRYFDANEMLVDIERLLDGKPTTIRLFPTTPQCQPSEVRNYQFSWELNTSARQLWPLVADTDRLNRAIGLPAPTYQHQGAGSERRIVAQANFNGMKVRWREHPFEWIRERNLSVLREFETGPFEWVTSTVELEPLVNDRCRLIHRFRVKPRGFFGKIFTPWQFGLFTKRSLDRVYRKLEVLANDSSCAYACRAPFQKSVNLTYAQRQRLEIGTALLAEPTTEKLANQLSHYLTVVADPSAARIRPSPLAAEIECSVDQSLTLCLNAVSLGLLKMGWDIICPICRIAAQTTDSIRNIEAHATCEFCNLEFDVIFAQSVELIFGVHPDIRKIDRATYCIGGPVHSPHVIAQNRLLPEQKIEINGNLSTGRYQVRGPQLNETWKLEVTEKALAHRAEIALGSPVMHSWTMAAGPLCMCLFNNTDAELLTRLEQESDRNDAITAADISRHPLFRQLFPSEVVTANDLLEIARFNLLAIWDTDSERTIQELGDVAMRSRWLAIEKIMAGDSQTGIDLIDSSHEHLVIAFESRSKLLEALLNWLSREPDQMELQSKRLAIAIHEGELMKGNQFGKSSYFGQALREIKSAMGAVKSEPQKISMLDFLIQDPEWQELVNQFAILDQAAPVANSSLVTCPLRSISK